MEPKRTIDSEMFVQDIRSGMTDDELARKYDLSARGLRRTFAKLIEAELISQADLDRRPGDEDDSVGIDLRGFID